MGFSGVANFGFLPLVPDSCWHGSILEGVVVSLGKSGICDAKEVADIFQDILCR